MGLLIRNGRNYSSSGASVEVQQILTEGTELATITVNGEATTIYGTDSVAVSSEAGNQIQTKEDGIFVPDMSYDDTAIQGSIDTLEGDSSTEGSVDYKIAQAVGDITQFDTSVVETLPETGVKGVIYFVPSSDEKESNIYNEFIWVTDKFEQIGSTEVDLTDYSTIENTPADLSYDSDTAVIKLVNNEGTVIGEGAALPKRVTLTQAEYDALPDTKLTDNVEYFITDAPAGGVIGGDATQISYKDSTVDATLTQLIGNSVIYQKSLSAGDTEVTYTSTFIDDNACFDWYADKDHSDLLPSDWSVTGNTLTVTYDAQDTDATVGVQIVKGVVIDG